jgi:hypothetical protein
MAASPGTAARRGIDPWYQHPRCSPGNTRKTTLLANSLTSAMIIAFIVEDSGFGEDSGVYSAPDLPHNPELPR